MLAPMTQAASTTGTTAARKLGPDYWRVWWANAISSTGDGAFVAALPLLAVTITRDPRLVSVVTADIGANSESWSPWRTGLPGGWRRCARPGSCPT